MSTIYDKNYNKATDGVANVTSIVVTGTTAGATTSNKNVFHWRLYLVIGTRSVVFDLTPGGDGQTGLLMVVSKVATGTTSRNAITYAVKPTANTNVQKYLDFIIANKLDKYKFDSTGSGCRWWCTVVLQKFEAAKLIDAGSAAAYVAWVDEQAKRLPANIPQPVRKGTFYE